MAKKIRMVKMTSTEIFRNQLDIIYDKFRHENTGDTETEFRPIHLGGLSGQRDILASKSVMRETKVTN